jgi:hypothetical protein
LLDVRNDFFESKLSFRLNILLVSGSSEEAEFEEAISKRIQFEDIFNSSFSVKRTNLVWVGNGNYLNLVIYSLNDTNFNTI